ncbi:hypothetical protein L1987_74228 [Smallanthus sonchifolius]|uniref:Uncharacterized protein n=1 Tax=Smallanthus sonchifolius TaxID=185202 RepID=A0ACB9A2D1_9ASTR|nr:hypothetical protein L1987_74228 [Smallanthus sonchifolius]
MRAGRRGWWRSNRKVMDEPDDFEDSRVTAATYDGACGSGRRRTRVAEVPGLCGNRLPREEESKRGPVERYVMQTMKGDLGVGCGTRLKRRRPLGSVPETRAKMVHGGCGQRYTEEGLGISGDGKHGGERSGCRSNTRCGLCVSRHACEGGNPNSGKGV